MRDEWWYASGGVRKGPVKFEDLRQKVLEGSLSAGDLIWTAGMSQWTPASDVPEFQKLIQLLPPELPNTAIPEPPELPNTAAPGPPESFETTAPLPLVATTQAPAEVPAGAWRRFFARYIDLWVIGLPTVFLVAFFLAPVWPGFARWLQQPNADQALWFLAIPLVLVIEAIIFGIFGTTLGKGLLGIHVTTARSKTPTFLQYLYRQLIVYWYGLGAGFPLVNLFTMARQYDRLRKGRATGYDEGLYKVTSSKVGATRYVLAVLVVVAMTALNGFFLLLDRADSNRGKDSTGYPTISESQRTNPVVAPTPQHHPGQVFKDCADCPEMVVIPAGSFMMGSNELPEETPIHPVSIRSFALGKYEVTQGQWRAVMGNNPSKFSNCGDNCPVEQVSWNDAHQFIQRLNQKTGKNYYLPSEAEWEYAARAGSTTRYWWGDMARREYANYGKDKCCGGYAEGQDRWVNTAPVGQFPVNPFGLHDMHGNVSELVEDRFNNNYVGAPSDGSAWMTGNAPERGRISRGGDWDLDVDRLRSSQRYSSTAVDESWAAIEYVNRDTSSQGSSTGFRLARAIQ